MPQMVEAKGKGRCMYASSDLLSTTLLHRVYSAEKDEGDVKILQRHSLALLAQNFLSDLRERFAQRIVRP